MDFFGPMVIKFGPLVFYLLSPLDSVVGPSSFQFNFIVHLFPLFLKQKFYLFENSI